MTICEECEQRGGKKTNWCLRPWTVVQTLMSRPNSFNVEVDEIGGNMVLLVFRPTYLCFINVGFLALLFIFIQLGFYDQQQAQKLCPLLSSHLSMKPNEFYQLSTSRSLYSWFWFKNQSERHRLARSGEPPQIVGRTGRIISSVRLPIQGQSGHHSAL